TNQSSSFNVGWFLSAAGLALVGRGLVGNHRACLLECATRSDGRAVGSRAELGISDSGWRRREASERTQAVVLLRGRSYSVTVGCSGFLRNAENCLTGPVV